MLHFTNDLFLTVNCMPLINFHFYFHFNKYANVDEYSFLFWCFRVLQIKRKYTANRRPKVVKLRESSWETYLIKRDRLRSRSTFLIANLRGTLCNVIDKRHAITVSLWCSLSCFDSVYSCSFCFGSILFFVPRSQSSHTFIHYIFVVFQHKKKKKTVSMKLWVCFYFFFGNGYGVCVCVCGCQVPYTKPYSRFLFTDI